MADDKKREQTMRTIHACCDIHQDTNAVVLDMEMPGVTRENLDIKVDGDHLIIHGTRNLPAEKGEYRIREIAVGDYHHEFTIDDTIDRNKINASIRNGVVSITLGIKESEKPRKIDVLSA